MSVDAEKISSEVAAENAERGQRGAMASQAVRLLCKAAGVLVLARLVTPAGHGQFALVASVWVLLSLFRDLGLGVAAVQARALSEEQKTALFWVHLLIGGALAAVGCGLAPVVAWFFGEPKLIPLMMVASGAFVLVGAGGLARGLLVREARFAEVNAVETWMAVAGTVAMLGAAWAGAEAFSFVVFLLISEAVATAMAWGFLRWKPKGAVRFELLRGLWRTGSEWLRFQLLGHALQQVDAVMVGRVLGVSPAGLYSRAGQLLAMPGLFVAGPLGQVAMVAMARAGEAGRAAEWGEHSRRTATVTAYLIWPLFALCVVAPDEVVRVVLGAQWPEAAPALRWLAVSAWAATVSALGNSIVVAAGQARRLIGGAVVNLLLVAAAVAVGLRHGLAGVACAVALANVVWAGPRLAWMLGGLPGEFARHARALVGPVVVTLVVAAGATLGKLLASDASWVWRLGAVCSGGLVTLLALTAVWPRVRREGAWVWARVPLPGRKIWVKEEA